MSLVVWVLALSHIYRVLAQNSTLSGSNTLTGSAIASSLLYPTGSYAEYTVTSTFSDTSTSSAQLSTNSTTSAFSNSTSSTTSSQTLLVGSTHASSSTVTSTRTSSSTSPTNTTPCNGHAEFCGRKYSNVSMVVAHNSPFDIAHNAASNQDLPVLTQLRDGIRGLQFETHMPNNTIRLCHTSCDLLDAGTLESYLATVVTWLQDNPYEVISIMMGNDDRVNPDNYIAPFRNSGMLEYVYTTPEDPMPLSAWPTLSEMILTNRRVVVMLDYLANQTAIPWLLDQFSQQWQTPFSPTEASFPCTAQRPPNQPSSVREDRMYMANHNLNVEVSISTFSILIPAYSALNTTNAVSGYGSLGRAVTNCTTMWDRPPNFLLVDYYNFGSFAGSVFQVAADANGVTYSRASCCGTQATTSAADSVRPSILTPMIAATFTLMFWSFAS